MMWRAGATGITPVGPSAPTEHLGRSARVTRRATEDFFSRHFFHAEISLDLQLIYLLIYCA